MDKYVQEEAELKRRLKKCEKLREEIKSSFSAQGTSISSLSEIQAQREEARARNSKTLQDLEKTKLIMRSQTIYTPTHKEEFIDTTDSVYRSCSEQASGEASST